MPEVSEKTPVEVAWLMMFPFFVCGKTTGNNSSNTVLVVSCWGFSHYCFQVGRDLSILPVKMNQYHGMTSQGFECNSFECVWDW